MRVHHLSCGTMCPRGGGWLDGRSGAPWTPAKLVCHVLLIETDRDGLVLVDSGIGLEDLRDPKRRLGSAFVSVANVIFDEADTARRRIEALGLDPEDVRHIVPTHMDLDHVGGLSDFPNATVHLFSDEHAAAVTNRQGADKQRYRPVQWSHEPSFEVYEADGEAWFGFRTVRALRGLPEELLLVPLIGHSRGHVGVAVDSGAGWLLHAGDAYFHEDQMKDPPGCPGGLTFFQNLVASDRGQMRHNQRRLRELVQSHGDEVTVFSAHDEAELDRLQAR